MFHLLFKGKNTDSRVEVLPMDLSAGEKSLKQVVHEAESLFSNAGVDYMIHNAAFERPVNITLIFFTVSIPFPYKDHVVLCLLVFHLYYLLGIPPFNLVTIISLLPKCINFQSNCRNGGHWKKVRKVSRYINTVLFSMSLSAI